jgi:uncharacterized protein with HEPN domain
LTEKLDALLLRLRDVAQEIAAFAEVTPRAEFDADVMKARSVIMSLMIVGELMGKIEDHHPHFAAAHPSLPWKQVRGLRNRIAHGYFGINREVIWTTATVSIPALIVALSDAIPSGTIRRH